MDREKILYKDELEKKRGTRDLNRTCFSVISILGAVIGFYVALTQNELFMKIFFLIIVNLCLIFFMGYYLNLLFEKSFRIFEKGVTIPGIHIRRKIILWDEIEKVTLEKRSVFKLHLFDIEAAGQYKLHDISHSLLELPQMRIILKNGGYFNVTSKHVSDPLRVLRIFTKQIPNKLDPVFEIYLGRGKALWMPTLRQTPNMQLFGIGLPFFMLAGGVVVLCLLSLLISDLTTFNIKLVWVTFMAFGAIFPILFAISRHLYYERELFIRYYSEITDEGIVLNNQGIGLFFRRTRDLIPFDEIKKFRTRLNPIVYGKESSFVMNDGTEYVTRYELYQKAERLSNFKRKRYALVNPNPKPVKEPAVSWNLWGISIFVVIVIVIVLVNSYGGSIICG